MKSDRIKKAESLGVEFTFTAEPEDIPVRGNAMASGDDALDKEAEDWIISELDRGNEYAWFCAKVTATLEIEDQTFTGADYLGGCSCKNEKDFLSGDYYTDMLEQALDALLRDLERTIGRGMMAKAGLVALGEVRS